DKIENGVIKTETEVKTIFYGDNINYPEIDNVAMNFISWQTDDGAEFNYTIMPDISENAESQEGDISIKITLNYNLIRLTIDYVIPESIGEITVLESRYDLDELRTLSYNVTESIILPEIESEYYEFIGWYTDENYANCIETVEKGSTGNLTLY